MFTPADTVDVPLAPAVQKWTEERVLEVRYWTPRLLSIRTTRPPAYRFTPGHYARIGLPAADAAIEWRPLSIVSGAADDWLEFLVALVPDGAFSLRVARLLPCQPVLVDRGAYGFLTVNQLAPGNDLWLLASGSGLGPFVSILRDESVWRDFDHLILVHSVRQASELAYRKEVARETAARMAGGARARFRYLPVVTRERCQDALAARIPALITGGELEHAAGVTLDAGHSRLMVCGNPDLLKDLRTLFSARGFQVNRRGVPGQMAFEKYW